MSQMLQVAFAADAAPRPDFDARVSRHQVAAQVVGAASLPFPDPGQVEHEKPTDSDTDGLRGRARRVRGFPGPDVAQRVSVPKVEGEKHTVPVSPANLV